jgi:hypothetical protein
MLIRTSRGAATAARVFLIEKRRGEEVRSARRPKVKLVVAIVRPVVGLGGVQGREAGDTGGRGTDYGKVLEVPAVGLVARVLLVLG